MQRMPDTYIQRTNDTIKYSSREVIILYLQYFTMGKILTVEYPENISKATFKSV